MTSLKHRTLEKRNLQGKSNQFRVAFIESLRTHASFGESVDVREADIRAMIPNILPPLLVGEDLDDIGPWGAGEACCAEAPGDTKDDLVIVTLWANVLIWSKRRHGEDQP